MTSQGDKLARKRAELAAELRKLEEAEKLERAARRAETKLDWRFELRLDEDKWERVLDPACTLYSLSGAVRNAKEAEEAGYSEFDVRGGGMAYYYNTLSGRFVGPTGGGTTFISDGDYIPEPMKTEAKADHDRIWIELGDFVAKNPAGGDVTSIVCSQRHAGWLHRK